MYLSRLTFAPCAVADREALRAFESPYLLHQALWQVFSDSPDRRRDFLYRLDLDAGRPRVYALSPRKPVGAGHRWQIDTKPFAPRVEPGDLLDFTLRANPVVTRNGKRHDVVMDAKRALAAGGIPRDERPTQAELAQEHAGAWLERRVAKHGFSLVTGTLRAEGHQVHRFQKPSGRPVHVATCDFQGVLRVDHPDRLLESITGGIGPAKGFGCGLLLVKRHRG
jgi:CRISPR system Cascade subunit CasE